MTPKAEIAVTTSQGMMAATRSRKRKETDSLLKPVEGEWLWSEQGSGDT